MAPVWRTGKLQQSVEVQICVPLRPLQLITFFGIGAKHLQVTANHAGFLHCREQFTCLFSFAQRNNEIFMMQHVTSCFPVSYIRFYPYKPWQQEVPPSLPRSSSSTYAQFPPQPIIFYAQQQVGVGGASPSIGPLPLQQLFREQEKFSPTPGIQFPVYCIFDLGSFQFELGEQLSNSRYELLIHVVQLIRRHSLSCLHVMQLIVHGTF